MLVEIVVTKTVIVVALLVVVCGIVVYWILVEMLVTVFGVWIQEHGVLSSEPSINKRPLHCAARGSGVDEVDVVYEGARERMNRYSPNESRERI